MRTYGLVAVLTIIVSTLFTTNAFAAKRGDCPECDFMPTPAQLRACVCPGAVQDAGRPPPPPPRRDAGVTEQDAGAPELDAGECGPNEERAGDDCVCLPGFEPFPQPDGDCVPKCTDGKIRDANGACITCGPKADSCCEEVRDRLAKAESKAEGIYALAWTCFILLLIILGLLGWGLKTRADQRLSPKKAA